MTFRQAFAKEAGRTLGALTGGAIGMLPIAAVYFAPFLYDAWREHRQRHVDEDQADEHEGQAARPSDVSPLHRLRNADAPPPRQAQ